MLGVEAKGSPVKGKVKDDGRWRANWWDFHPLVDDIHRPVAWSTSSIIFTAHPSQPLLLGRLFPSSRQFVVSPEPILRASSSYEPASVISVSPNDHWLFAYFPAREGDGIGCLWKRGSQVDSWIVWECWPFSPGAGVVTAAWAGMEREWVTSSDGFCSRLPPRGPLTPVSNPTLLLVTQSHELHVCYLRTYIPSLKILSCSLSQPSFFTEGQARTSIHDVPSGPKASRLCIKATIEFLYNGMLYNEPSLLVAMRSQRYPSSESLKPAAHNDIDLGLPLDLPQDPIPEEQPPPLDWGALAEELTIELCEVKFRFDGSVMAIMSFPLPPLHHPLPHLTNLAFTCTPPPKLDPNNSPRASPKKDKQPGRPISEPATTFLVASFLDCDDYSSVPKSEMVAYSITRVAPSPSTKFTWSIRQVAERPFSPRVLLSFSPGRSPVNLRKGTVVAMLADIAGSTSRGGHKAIEVAVGCFAVLQLPDLSDDPEWDRPSIMSPVSRAGMDWPVSFAVSANRALLCAASMTRTSIYSLPKLHIRDAEINTTRLSPLSVTLASALVSHKSIIDIAHILSMPTMPMERVIDTLSGILLSWDVNARAGSVSSFTLMEAVGAEVEIYKARARQSTDDDEKEFLTSLWKNALDICSLASIITAFEDCKDTGGYDLDAVWQLLNLSEWAVHFLEILIKECLTLSNLTDLPQKDVQMKPEPVDDDPFLRESLFHVAPSPFDKPVLLHLAHPLLLANLIDMTSHVNKFYQYLMSQTAKAENAQIARDILLDAVDCSGLNLEGLESVFRTALGEVNCIPGEDTRLSLAKCHPVAAQRDYLKGLIQILSTSSAINKPRLFIKPSDLVDGFVNLSISEPPQKEQGRDIVTKALLMKCGVWLTCLRCGHHSDVGGEVGVDISLAWRSWERTWMSECVCGGAWASGNI